MNSAVRRKTQEAGGLYLGGMQIKPRQGRGFKESH
jgi:hypothetical protein